MDATVFQDLTTEETEMVWGGMSSGMCAAYGMGTALAFLTGNALAGTFGLLAAINGGCFD